MTTFWRYIPPGNCSPYVKSKWQHRFEAANALVPSTDKGGPWFKKIHFHAKHVCAQTLWSDPLSFTKCLASVRVSLRLGLAGFSKGFIILQRSFRPVEMMQWFLELQASRGCRDSSLPRSLGRARRIIPAFGKIVIWDQRQLGHPGFYRIQEKPGTWIVRLMENVIAFSI